MCLDLNILKLFSKLQPTKKKALAKFHFYRIPFFPEILKVPKNINTQGDLSLAERYQQFLARLQFGCHLLSAHLLLYAQ